MKTLTKILIVLSILMLIPTIFLAKYFFIAIVPSELGFSFFMTPLAWTGLVFIALSAICLLSLYIVFLRSMKLSNLLFFSVLPFSLVYGVFVVYVSQIGTYNDITSEAVKSTLNINTVGDNNSILWITFATLIYLSIVLLILVGACKPLKRVERIVLKLGDGRMTNDNFKIGGGKQFREIEESLNKINYNYKEKENRLKVLDLTSQKKLSKQFYKFIGNANIEELELGKNIKKKACILFCELKTDTEKTLTLEENFNYINSYMKVVVPLITRYEGFIDKYLESGLQVVFAKTQNAIECAHAILKAINIKNKGQENKIDARISLHFGEVVFGIVGSDEKKVPAIISGIENLFVKMEEINDFIGSKIIMTKEVVENLPEDYLFEFRNVGSLSLDKTEYILLESLAYYPKNLREKLKKSKKSFESGIRYFNDHKYDEAKECFQEVLHLVPSDKPSFVYFNKANEKLIS